MNRLNDLVLENIAREAWAAAARTGSDVTPYSRLDPSQSWANDGPLSSVSLIIDGTQTDEEAIATWGTREAGRAFVAVVRAREHELRSVANEAIDKVVLPHGRCFLGLCVEHALDRRVPACGLDRPKRGVRSSKGRKRP